MRVIRLLALRRLRLQPLRSLLAAVVVGGGTSLVVTILVITSSLTTSVNEAATALAGPAPLRVLGPLQRGGIDPEAVDRIAAVDGVAAVVPLVQSITVVDPGSGPDLPVTILGFDCRVGAILGDIAGACSDEVLAQLPGPLVGAGLAHDLGPGAAVKTNLGRLPLTKAIAVDGLDRINDGHVVALPMAVALTELGRDDRVDVVYVMTEPDAEVADVQARIDARLPESFAVLDVLDPPPIVGVIFATFVPLFSIIALLTLGIGGVLVRNSIMLSLEERRRQTAIVGALGGSRRLLVGGTLAEMVLLGAVGGLIGVAAGVGLAGPVSGGLDEISREVAGIPLSIHVPPSAVVAGLLLGVVVAIGSAIGPVRRAVRIDVAAELASRGRREEAAGAGSGLQIGLSFVVVAIGAVVTSVATVDAGIEGWRATLAPVGFLTLTLGSVLVVSTTVPLLLVVLERRVRFKRGASRLALSNLRREPRRSAVMALALGFAMGVGFITASFTASITQAIESSLIGNFKGVQVSRIDPNNSANSEARLGPDTLATLERLPGVASVERAAFMLLGNEAGKLIGVQAYTEVWENLHTAVGRFSPSGLDAGQVSVGPGLARDLGLRPGDRLTIATPSGDVSLPVMAVMFDGNFGGRSVQMSYDLMVRLYGEQSPVSVIVNPDPGVSEAELIATIERADLDRGLFVEGFQDVLDRNAREVASQLSTFDAIQRGLMVMSFVAVLSTLLLVGIQRQREFGMLAAVGMTPRELRRMVLTEAGIVALLGVLVTGVMALVMYWGLNAMVPILLGWKDPFVVDGGAYATYSGVAMVTALLAALYPSIRAGRVEVLEALRYE